MAATGAEVAAAVVEAHRREWASVLAATVRVTGDLDAAEDAAQDAYAAALSAWVERGIPANPGAWLTTAARRRAIDGLRHLGVAERTAPLLVPPEPETREPDEADFADDRLRLVFVCCHPAFDPETRIALTLRFVCGLSTAQVASALLVQETTMAARITRAKRKIAIARIPYSIPLRQELTGRVESVLDVVHLVYSAGHLATEGDALERRELAERGIDLAEMLHRLLPAEPEVAGLLALVLLTEARRGARVAHDGRVVLLEDQDRSRWDRALIRRGTGLLARNARAGRFALLAAIAAVHDTGEDWAATDWPRIVALYDRLLAAWPSPVVALNRAIAVGFASGPGAGLDALEPLLREPRLAGYPYLAAARGTFLERLDRVAEAAHAYDEAILLSGNAVERADLERRRAALHPA